MHSYRTSVQNAWQSAFSENVRFQIESVLSIALLILLLIGVSRFFLWVETRPGVVVSDPLLALFHARFLTWVTFSFIYGALFLAIVSLLQTPVNFIQAIQSYIVLTLFRVVLMWSLPLDPPLTAIPLSDPFVEVLGTGKLLTKDLFFSGHTSFMFLLYLVCNTKLRTIFLLSTLAVGACVLMQHVHYTVDVLVAPFIAYGSFRLVKKINYCFSGQNCKPSGDISHQNRDTKAKLPGGEKRRLSFLHILKIPRPVSKT